MTVVMSAPPLAADEGEADSATAGIAGPNEIAESFVEDPFAESEEFDNILWQPAWKPYRRTDTADNL